MREALGFLGSLIIVAAIIAAVMFGGFYAYQYFAPKYEGVRRDVFEQSKTFHDGTVRTIRDYEYRWRTTTDPIAKAGIKAAVFHELNSFSEDKLPSDLRKFVDELRVNNP